MLSVRPRTILLAALVLASCGSSESDKTAPFVGNWTVAMGTLTAMCPAPLGTSMLKLDGGQQTITKTADGALSISILPNCNITLDVSGSAASLRMTNPPQNCMFKFMGLDVMGTFTAGSFTLNGETASFSYVGNATLAAGAIMCPVNGMGTSMKSAPADGGSAADAGSGSTTDGP
jgi:hypothetical protein